MLVVPAYAKVNLALEVTGRRPDGWHDIASVVCTVDWHDLAGMQLREGAGAPKLRLTGPFAEGVPAGEANLAVRAARLLLELAGVSGVSFELWLSKQVPAAAGLGGGSADAAAVLRGGAALLAARGVPIAPEQLVDVAATLGSDVPAVLAGGTLLATGRGERLTPLPSPALHLAVAMAGASSTAATYAALTDEERSPSGRVERLAEALRAAARPPAGPLADAGGREADRAPGAQDHEAQRTGTPPGPAPGLLGSALEPAACRAAPGLGESLARLRATTPGAPWHLTGSGGAAFAVATSAAQAAQLAARAAAAGFPARACRTVATRLGPLPHGAPR